MSSNINLVSVIKDEKARQKNRVKIARIASIAFLAAVCLSSVIIFIINAFSPLQSILKDQDVAKKNLSLIEQKHASLDILNGRLNGVLDISKKRKDYTHIIGVIIQQIPPGTNISSLSIDKSGLSLAASSNSLSSINDLINNMKTLSVKKQTLENIDMDSLIVDPPTGNYSVSFRATLL